MPLCVYRSRYTRCIRGLTSDGPGLMLLILFLRDVATLADVECQGSARLATLRRRSPSECF